MAGILGLGAAGGSVLASWPLIDHGAETSSTPPGYSDTTPSGTPSPKDPTPRAPGRTNPSPAGTPKAPLPEIPGTGVLRQGDSGHGVYELQVRLQQLPDIYVGGPVDGRYDKEVRAAVTRFQKRYGIRGDEKGVYGDNTRHALMLRTE